jgi:hypothetical protein
MIVATTPGCDSRPSSRQDRATTCHELVAIDGLALLVHDEHAVRVAVERDADVGAQFPHLAGERVRARSSRHPD